LGRIYVMQAVSRHQALFSSPSLSIAAFLKAVAAALNHACTNSAFVASRSLAIRSRCGATSRRFMEA